MGPPQFLRTAPGDAPEPCPPHLASFPFPPPFLPPSRASVHLSVPAPESALGHPTRIPPIQIQKLSRFCQTCFLSSLCSGLSKNKSQTSRGDNGLWFCSGGGMELPPLQSPVPSRLSVPPQAGVPRRAVWTQAGNVPARVLLFIFSCVKFRPQVVGVISCEREISFKRRTFP